MEIRVHADPVEFWSLARPYFAADAIRHGVAATVLQRLALEPSLATARPVLLSLWEEGILSGIACRTPPRPLIASGVPARAADLVAAKLSEIDPTLPGVIGPRDAAEPFARAWSRLTHAKVREAMAMRVYRLESLVLPATPGGARLVTDAEVEQLAVQMRAFELEAVGREVSQEHAAADIRSSMAAGHASMTWETGGEAVSWARASAPLNGMSHVNRVYTPPELRGRGYGAAITAAASQWALHAGAKDVVLFTDLANPTSNSIYQKIGYRPLFDAVDLAFQPA